ncbi:MAG TPA: YbaB/EbfC family nucleoid-associated protein [Pseudonocardiaceae bacterium]|jgi:DNA-binding protein YbaB
MDDRRWGFEEADDREFEETRPSRNPTSGDGDTVSGRDADGVVTVTVTPSAEVVSVRLTAGWRNSVEPRMLPALVIAAANAATMQALVAQVDQREQSYPATVEDSASGPADRAGTAGHTPLTKEDVLRLVDAVSADLELFSHRLSEVVDRTVSAESAGRRISGSGQHGQVVELVIDASWAGRVRDSEIENELVNVLRKLQRAGSPGDLANGPQSSAIEELTALASDPHNFLRRLGLLS